MKQFWPFTSTFILQCTIIIYFMCLNAVFCDGATSKVKQPDFAFPEKVEKTASADLQSALKTGNGKAAVNAMIRLGLAKAQINTDSLPSVLEQISQLTAREQDPATKALLNALSAEIYVDIFNRDRRKYQNRDAVSNAGDDYTLWNISQFRDKVIALTEASLAEAVELQRLPIEDFKEVITIKDSDVKFYPTLYDFIALQGISSLDCFARCQNMSVLNIKLLETPCNPSLRPGETCAPLGKILEVYSQLIDYHSDDFAPLFTEEIAVRKFVKQYLFLASDDEDDTQQLLSKEMLRLYNLHKENEYAGLFLYEAAKNVSAGSDATDIYKQLDDYLNQFPNSFCKNNISNCLQRIVCPSATIEMPTVVAPYKPIDVAVTSINGKNVKLEVFDISNRIGIGADENWITAKVLGTPIEVKTLAFDNKIPFSAKANTTLTFSAYGLYVVRVSVDGIVDKDSLRIIRCSDLSLSTFRVGENVSAWVVDATTGLPVSNAQLYFDPWSRKTSKSPLKGLTNYLGEQQLNIEEYGLLSVAKGEDKFAEGFSVASPYLSEEKKSLGIEMFTSLGLYRPGDEVDFALVAYEKNVNSRNISQNRLVRVELCDANRQSVDTVFITTDVWGRAVGKFTLPSNGLTGNYLLRAGVRDDYSRSVDVVATRSFVVSDYKLPTFHVDQLAVNPPVTNNDGATIEGKAVSYSGFPISEAIVKASLKVERGFWWWKTVTPVFFNCETVTDIDGKFKIEIPASVIAASPVLDGVFVCDIEVTSADGETQMLTSSINMGKQLALVVSIPSEINLVKPISASVEAKNTNGESIAIDVKYTVKRDTISIAEGVMTTGSLKDVISTLQTGSYQILFAPVDSSLANNAAPTNFVVYRPNDEICPVEKPLWVPSETIHADSQGVARVIVGSNCEDANVRMIVSVYPGVIVDKRWITLRKGLQEITIKLPAYAEHAVVDFDCVKDYDSWSYKTTIDGSASEKSIKIEIETFRDNVMPGQEETVTFRVKPIGSTTAESAVFLDMSNKAIDVLASNPLNMSSLVKPRWTISSNGWRFRHFSESASQDIAYSKEFSLEPPSYMLYGLSFTGGGNRLYRSLSRKAYGKVEMLNGVEPAGVSDMAETYDSGVVATEAAVEESSVETNVTSPEQSKVDVSYRPSEIPLAFFRPLLNTAEDGSLEISYKVPDANTTWVLRAMAYNKDLLTSSASTEIVSSKPVMVSQNAPRFLRTADSVELAASIMNNTDSQQIVTVVSEIVAASDKRIIARDESVVSLDSMRSTVVKISVDAPVGESGLIYRVRASADGYVDGEQTLLPILPSQQDVVESQIFYIAPNQSRFTLDLPAMSGKDRAYLNFTENPAWQVVSALPGLRDMKINSSIEASASLFSAAVADGIMRDNPEVARVLRRWLDNPEDSALVSVLDKNQEIKNMLLSSTPWVSEALSDTQRMQRLALLFDKRQTSQAITIAIDRLSKMYCDGGWMWTECFPRMSYWATEIILDQLGELKRLGWLPSDSRLNKMIQGAVESLDRHAVDDYRKSPDADYWLYVSIRDNFSDIKLSTAASRVVDSEVRKALSKWKSSNVAMKGIYALILHNHGYKATARQVLESLRQYATTTPEKGMWWQQLDRNFTLWSFTRIGVTALLLDAFNAIEPGCDDIYKIRQWLILNKTNNDWGNSIMTAQTIAAILRSGKPLTVNTRGTAIHIGNTLLESNRVEYATGEFSEQITPLLTKNETLTIDRQADYPSVGGIVTMRHLPMSSVRSVGCQEILVEKSLCVFNGEEWVPGNEFNVGDKVRVELTLKVENDLSYVVIEDYRAAGLEPVEQLPKPIFSEGIRFYRENRDSQTNIFVDCLPRGVYRLSYDLFASQSGSFASGVAQVQSQYNPIVSAHSAGMTVKIL